MFIQTGCYESVCKCTVSILSMGSLGEVFAVKIMGTGCVRPARNVRSDRSRFELGVFT